MLGHWIWNDNRELSRAEAWIYLLMVAQHGSEPRKVMVKDKILWCHRGESLRSLETLSKDWNWNRSKVRRFLKLLEGDSMIRHTSETVTSRISICNYDTYQKQSAPNETQMKQKRNASETHSTTDNNVNNENKESRGAEVEKSEPRKSTNPSKPKTEPKENEGLHPLHRRFILMFQGAVLKDIRPAAEERAWKKIEAHCDESDVCLLEWFYALPKNSEKCDKTWNRKTTASILMNDFATQLENAAEHKAGDRKQHTPTPLTKAPVWNNQ